MLNKSSYLFFWIITLGKNIQPLKAETSAINNSFVISSNNVDGKMYCSRSKKCLDDKLFSIQACDDKSYGARKLSMSFYGSALQ